MTLANDSPGGAWVPPQNLRVFALLEVQGGTAALNVVDEQGKMGEVEVQYLARYMQDSQPVKLIGGWRYQTYMSDNGSVAHNELALMHEARKLHDQLTQDYATHLKELEDAPSE